MMPGLVPSISTSLPMGTPDFHKDEPKNKASWNSSDPGIFMEQLAPGTESMPLMKLCNCLAVLVQSIWIKSAKNGTYTTTAILEKHEDKFCL